MALFPLKTNINMTQRMRKDIKKCAEEEKISQSELIRKAIAFYLLYKRFKKEEPTVLNNNTDDEEVVAALLDYPKELLTCFNCTEREECEFVDDLYNTDGDCLAMK